MRPIRMRRLSPRKQASIRIWLITALIFSGIIILDMRMRPTIQTMSAYQAKVYSGRLINEAISEELEQENIRYSNLVSLTMDGEGKVTSLQTDMVALNRLKTNISNKVLTALGDMENQDISVPIGTLFGGQLFSGRGPDIPFQIVHTGFMETELENRFDSAGINQTRHQIMLKINLKVSAIIPGYSTSTEINMNFCLAETVIIGIVPEAFTNVESSPDDVVGDIFDFGAEKNETNEYASETLAEIDK